jgi:hypothetical protein
MPRILIAIHLRRNPKAGLIQNDTMAKYIVDAPP